MTALATPVRPAWGGWRSWTAWGIGLFAYVMAVFQRTSFGVAGVPAAHRFGTTASVVGMFVVVQLLVYALMQIPAGVLGDRFGSRLTIGIGAMVMTAGQLDLALADSVPTAMAARVLVGAGDSLTFTCVVKLLPSWFESRHIPMLTQLTNVVGQLGQVLSSVPFAALLAVVGWTRGFGAAAACSALSSALVLALLRNTPPGTPLPRPAERISVRSQVHATLREPGTRLGYWCHWLSGFPGLVFAMMWGYPFLERGQGLSVGATGSLFVVYALASAGFGPPMGVLTARHPLRRSNLVLGLVGLQIGAWTMVLARSGPSPMWLLTILVFTMGAAGAGCSVGFDFARTHNPGHRNATAVGVVTMGCFCAGVIAIPLVGRVLDWRGGDYSLSDFRWAMSVQYPLFAVGLAGLFASRRACRRKLASRGIVVPSWPDVVRREWRARRGWADRPDERVRTADPRRLGTGKALQPVMTLSRKPDSDKNGQHANARPKPD